MRDKEYRPVHLHTELIPFVTGWNLALIAYRDVVIVLVTLGIEEWASAIPVHVSVNFIRTGFEGNIDRASARPSIGGIVRIGHHLEFGDRVWRRRIAEKRISLDRSHSCCHSSGRRDSLEPAN